MKKKLFTITVPLLLFFFYTNTCSAVVAVKADFLAITQGEEPETTPQLHTKANQKRKTKTEKKKKAKRTKAKKGTAKWMWIGLGGWFLGIAIYLINIAIANSTPTVGRSNLLQWLGASIFLLGTISLVIWLIKKFGKKDA